MRTFAADATVAADWLEKNRQTKRIAPDGGARGPKPGASLSFTWRPRWNAERLGTLPLKQADAVPERIQLSCVGGSVPSAGGRNEESSQVGGLRCRCSCDGIDVRRVGEEFGRCGR